MAHILLVGNWRVSLTLARRLARAGRTVSCGVDRPDPYLFKSRAIRSWFAHPSVVSAPEAAVAAVLRHLDAHPEIDALVPVSEAALRAFLRARDRLPAGVRLIAPGEEAVETALDKAAAFALCDRLGVPVATRTVVTDRPALLAAVHDIGLPCVVKPVDGARTLFGVKAVLLRLGDDSGRALPCWPAAHAALCVQRLVDGPRVNVVFAAREGRLIGAVACESRRTDRADGTGYSTHVISVAPAPQVVQASERLLEALGYTGVGMLQFLVDGRTGAVSFLELNPRLAGTYRAAELCGLPVSELMLRLGLGEPVEVRAHPWSYPVGRRLVWTKGDLSGLAAELRRGAVTPGRALAWLAAAGRDAVRRDHLTFDLRDPAPTLWLYLHPVLGRLGRRRRGAPALAGLTPAAAG